MAPLRFAFLSAFSVPRSRHPRPSDARSPSKIPLRASPRCGLLQVAHPRSQVGFGVLKNIAHGSLQLGWRLREHQAAFQKKGANLVDHSGTSRNQQVANAVNGL